MSQSIQYYWPTQDLEGVALTQNVASPGLLVLNGTYSLPTTTTIDFFSNGFVRNVSLTSVNDLSAAVFTITGVQNSTVVTSVVPGPNNDTVYTNESFDIISSVSVSIPVNGISIGLGFTGFFPLFTIPSINGAFTFSPYAFAFSTDSVNGCDYQLYESLRNLSNNGQTYASLVNNTSAFIPVGSYYIRTTQILQMEDTCYNILIAVVQLNASSTLATQFLQLN